MAPCARPATFTDMTAFEPGAQLALVTPYYFKTLQILLIAGRTFTESDDEDAPRVGIIDERLAKRISAMPIQSAAGSIRPCPFE